MRSVRKLLALSALLTAAACADGSDDTDGRDVDVDVDRDGPTASTGGRIDDVDSALVSPTGAINQTSARAAQADSDSYNEAHAAFDAVLFVRSPGAKACLRGTDEDGTYDLACASTGTLSGSIIVKADASASNAGANAMVTVELRDVCAGTTCVNATGELRLVAAGGVITATAALDAKVSGSRGSASVTVGAKGTVGAGALDGQVVFFDSNGDSIVVEAAVGSDVLGAYTLRGANGDYKCASVLDQKTCTGEDATVIAL